MNTIIGSYTELENRLIAAAYYTSNRLDEDSITIEDIEGEFSFPMPDRFLRIALKNLYEVGYSEEELHSGSMAEQRIWLTARGLREAETIIQRGETDVLNFRAEKLEAPASDRTVSFEDNREAVEFAIDRLGQAQRAITESNTLAPEEKELWVKLIDQGKELFKKPSTYVASVSALLVKPLYDAYASVIEDASKPIVLAAIEAIKALLT